jgi:hypothetical protein
MLLSKFLIRQDNETKPYYEIFSTFPIGKEYILKNKIHKPARIFQCSHTASFPSLEERQAVFFPQRSINCRYNSPAHKGIVLNYALPVSAQLTVCL